MPAPGTISLEREFELITTARDVLSRFPCDPLGLAMRNEVVMANLGLVKMFNGIVNAMRLSNDEAISYAAKGIIDAFHRFDLSRGVRFSTYAGWCIRGEFSRIRGRKRLREFSLRGDVGFHEDDGDLSSTFMWNEIPDRRDDAVPAFFQEHDLAQVAAVLSAWDESGHPRRRFALVLRNRFGIGGAREHTLESLGVEMKITKERVRQLQRDAVALFAREYDTYTRTGELPEKAEASLVSA